MHRLTADIDVVFVEMQSYQLVHALQAKKVDVGVWNYDDILDKGHKDLNYVYPDLPPELLAVDAAVMLCKKNDDAMMAIVKSNAIHADVLDIQQKVMQGEKMPNY